MADNTDNYTSYAEIMAELYFSSSSLISTETTTLSGKVVDAGGDKYTFTGGTPKVGQVITQSGYSDEIIDVTGSVLQISKTGSENKIIEDEAIIISSTKVGKGRIEEMILDAMGFIDEQTGQFFNKRDLDIKLEGNNSSVLFLPVPIISITQLILNGDDELDEGEDEEFFAFKGRQSPQDDRRNPRIKLNIGIGDYSVYTGLKNQVFAKRALTQIVGSFGFLEADGSTPRLISKATKILVLQDVNSSIGSAGSAESSVGNLRRRKVDLHEIEFFDKKGGNQTSSLYRSESGDKRVDEIIAKYRTPIRISGSIKMRRLTEDEQYTRPY